MLNHPYGLKGQFYTLFIGLMFSLTYTLGGLSSSILAHTIHNFLVDINQNILNILTFAPVLVNINNFLEKLKSN